MITTTIAIDDYVAEYIFGKYYNPEIGAVHFPSSLDIYIAIYDLLEKRPASCPVDSGNLTFALPDRREGNVACGKSPEQYNYLSGRSAKILGRRMRLMMWAELHEMIDENKHLRGIEFKESVYIFLKRYCITSIGEDGLLKNYQRWRDKLRRSVKRGYRKK